MDHSKTPLFSAVKAHIDRNVIPFHVPGHKHGVGAEELRAFTGNTIFQMDLNAMEDIDDICNPISSIKESHELIADAFGADHAFMLTNGTTAGIHAMMLTAAHPGDKIILPRNAHKSTISALILSGVIPVYTHAEFHPELGISTCVSTDALKQAFEKEPHAVASFSINPSYYGFTPNLKEIVELSHQYEALALVDEAHGCHFKFHPEFPISAMDAGADMSACSTHKTCGSFTQSSILLMKEARVEFESVKQVLNLQRSTSGSYLLMTSIDTARKQLMLHGNKLLDDTLELARYAREKINNIDGLYAFGKELISSCKEVYHFDETKLTVNVRDIGLTGYEVETLLREKYQIQIELADLSNIMAIITLGDTQEHIDALVSALQSIALHHSKPALKHDVFLPEMPDVIVIPRDAFYAQKKSVSLSSSVGEIAGESVMAYPPGIPIICPGERITQEIVNYIQSLKKQNCSLQGTADPYIDTIRVLGH